MARKKKKIIRKKTTGKLVSKAQQMRDYLATLSDEDLTTLTQKQMIENSGVKIASGDLSQLKKREIKNRGGNAKGPAATKRRARYEGKQSVAAQLREYFRNVSDEDWGQSHKWHQQNAGIDCHVSQVGLCKQAVAKERRQQNGVDAGGVDLSDVFKYVNDVDRLAEKLGGLENLKDTISLIEKIRG